MLSIGEFSRVTQLSVKALRLYHDKGILIPDKIDLDSKYRYYRSAAVDRAIIIKRLKDMDFTLNEIKMIMLECTDDRQLVEHVRQKMAQVNEAIRKQEDKRKKLDEFLLQAKEEPVTTAGVIQVEVIPDTFIAGIRFKGKYPDVGDKFAMLGKKCGRYAAGKPFTLYYDNEYKEDDADIEACFPLRKEITVDGLDCRLLKGGERVTLLHRGPYSELHHSYRFMFEYLREKGKEMMLPIREEYIKGPGMIFKVNPKKFVTRIIITGT